MDHSTLNEQLRGIYDKLHNDKILKKALEFEVRRKGSRSSEWENVYNFNGLDFETLNILHHPHRPLWVQQPEHFVSFSNVPAWVANHPAVQMGCQLLALGKVGARDAILRRAHMVVFEELCKEFNISIEALAGQLAPCMTLPPDWDNNQRQKKVVDEVGLWRKAGSRYAVWQNDLGTGIIVVMGTGLGHDLSV
jgi:hypothetical protein